MPFTLSNETTVNQQVQSDQLNPQVIQLADGRLLFTWQTADPDLDGNGTAIASRIGTPQADGSIVWSAAGEFVVNQETEGAQSVPQVTQLPDGRVVFVYTTADPNIDGSGTGIAIRVGTVQANGSVVWAGAGEFYVNGNQVNAQEIQQIVTLSDGRVMVTWHTADPSVDGNADAVSVRIGAIQPDGSVVWGAAGEFRVNEEVTGSQSGVNVIQLADGRLMFTWQSADADVDGNGAGISVRIGTAQANGSITWGSAGEVTVNAEIANDQTLPQLTQLADGRVLLTWQSGDPDSVGISARVGTVQADGSMVWGAAGEFSVNTLTGSGSLGAPDVIQAADGTIIFTWPDSHADVDGDGFGIAGRAGVVQANGSIAWLTTEQIQVDLHGAGDQLAPHMTTLSNGNVVIVWSSASSLTDGDGAGIVVQTVLFGPNTPPVAQDDAFAGGESLALSSELFGDHGAGADDDANFDAVSVSAVNGVGASVGNQIALASGALLTVNADGTFSYSANGAFEYLAIGQNGVDSFAYTISDGHGGADTATVTITLTGVNDAPVAHNDAIAANEAATASGNVLANNGSGADSDIDTGAALTVTHVNGVGASVGNQITLASGARLTLNANGAFDYDPNGSFESLAVGQSATDSFTYTLDDGHGGTSTATATITINGVNDAPAAHNDAASTNEATPLAGNVLADNGAGADSDVDTGDTLTVTHVNGVGANVGNQIALASGALLTLNANGTFDYNPNGAFESLAVGQSTTDSFAYTIGDGHGGASTATATITIDGVNDAPAAHNDAASTNEATPLAGNVLADNGAGADSDIDTSDTLTITHVNGVGASVGTQITLASGALLTLNADGAFDYNPNGAFESLAVGETATDSFTYTIGDGHGGTSTATATITIDGANDAPVTHNDAIGANEAAIVSGNVLANNGSGADSDVDTSDALTLTHVNGVGASVGNQIALASGALLTLNADGAFDYNPNGSFESLAVGETATDSFTYTIADGHGGTSTATATITIDGANDAPVAINDAFGTDEASPATGNLLADNGSAADSDVDASDVLTIAEINGVGASVGSQVALGSGALLTVNGDGAFSYSANGAFESLQVGDTANDSFNYTISDGHGGTSTATVTITINGLNDAPVASPDAISADEATPVVGNVFADNGAGADSDVDATDVLTVTEVNGVGSNIGAEIPLASGALLTLNANGTFDYNPNGAFESLSVGETATDSFTYSISDGHGGTSTGTATITINGVNDAPVARNDAIGGDEATPVVGNLFADNGTGADSDVDASDVLTVSEVNGAGANVGDQIVLNSGALLTVNNDGTFGYDANGAFESLAVGETASDSFTYTVSDGHGGSGAATVTITLDGVNDAPVAHNDGFGADEATAIGGNVLANNGAGADGDVDASDTLTVTAVNGVGVSVGNQITLASGALVTLNADGTFDYNPNGSFESLAVGETANDSFTYTVGDGHGGTGAATVTITLDGVNDAPVAYNDGFSTDDATVIAGNVLANNGADADGDVDASDTLTVTAVNDVGAGVGNQITLASGALLTLNADGTFDYDPNGAFDLGLDATTSDSFTYTIGDGHGGVSTATATVTINSVDQTLTGTSGIDTLFGLTGDDVLVGLESDDTLNGGVGADVLNGGDGADTASYANAVVGVTASLATPGANTGEAAGDSYTSIENLTGSAHDDTLMGDSGNNVIAGDAGADTMAGGLGDDLYSVDDAGDVVSESASQGTDTVRAAITYTLGLNVEHLTLTGNAEINATGNIQANTLTGNGANNILDGGAGADTMIGGDGDDTYYVDNAGDITTDDGALGGVDTVISSVGRTLGAALENLTLTDAAASGTGNELNNSITGNDVANILNGKAGDDTVGGGAGADTLYGGDGDDTLNGGGDADLLDAGANNDTLNGGDGADQLYGRAGVDTLDGGLGADTMFGGAGDDTYVVDDAGDVVGESASAGIDTILSSVTRALGQYQENLTLTGLAAIDGVGNILANVMSGNGAANVLSGAAGFDTLNGNGGADILNGGDGNDTLNGGADDDTLDGGNDTDTLNGGDGVDTLYGRTSADTLNGDAGNDALYGGDGDDTMNGGTDDDLLDGGNHDDTLNGGDGTDTLYGRQNHDTLNGDAGTDTLYGGDGDDNLNGGGDGDYLDAGNGADTLDGGLGSDSLIGGAGGDAFVFSTALGGGNVDAIVGFTVAEDVIRLDTGIFTAIGAGILDADAFVIGSAAVDAGDRIVYDAATGALSYDADGVGAGVAVQFATLATGLALTNDDFFGFGGP